jgi:hypothetical protein
MFGIMIPLLFGIFNEINTIVIKKYNNINYSLIVGAIFGLLLSSIGRFYLNLPKLLFGFKQNEHNVHIIAVILYALIFRLIATPLTKQFI